MKPRTVTINEDQKLYVIQCGRGYTCLGFDVLETRYKRLANELVERGWKPPVPAYYGTVDRYRQYEAALAFAEQLHARTGWRSKSELTKELIGLEGKRVLVRHRFGETEEKSEFIVGKSTGFIPCHLEITGRDKSGGPAVCLGEILSVTTLY